MVVYFPLRGFSVAGLTHNPESCSECQSDAVPHGDVFKIGAISEHMIPDTYRTLRERDVHKDCVTREPQIVDARDTHTLRKRDVRKAFAIGERGIADSLHAVRNCDVHKTLATAERPITDLLDTVGNRDVCKVRATVERRLADARNAVRNRNAGKTLATIERKTADPRDAVRNRNARQTATIGERQGTYSHDLFLVIDRGNFDVGVGAGSDSGNRTGSVTIGLELQAFRVFVQGGSGGKDSGGFHGENPFFPWRSSLGVMPYALGVTISAGTVL